MKLFYLTVRSREPIKNPQVLKHLAVFNYKEHFDSIDELLLLLSDKNSYVRTRGFGLICCQARWDKEGKIKSVWDKMIPLLNDPKPND